MFGFDLELRIGFRSEMMGFEGSDWKFEQNGLNNFDKSWRGRV